MQPESYWKIGLVCLALLFFANLAQLALLATLPLIFIGYGFYYKKSWAKFVYFPYFTILLLFSLSLVSFGLSFGEKSSAPAAKGIDFGKIPGGSVVSFDEVVKEYSLFAGSVSLIINLAMLFIGWKARSQLSN